MRIKKILNGIMAGLCAIMLSQSVFATETYPKREMRSTWVASLGIDWPTTRGTTASAITNQKSEAIKILDQLQKDGFNSVFLHVRPYADRIYAKNSWTDPKTGTTYKAAEPWSSYLTGKRGSAPSDTNYDPLEFWVEEAHKRGMELHAWINPYRIVNDLTGTPEDQAVASWIISYQQSSTSSVQSRFNPALSQTIARIQNVCRVLTGNYDIDGIVFDDYFYPDGMGNLTATTAPDYANYQDYKSKGGTMGIADWRRDNVNRMVKEVNATIKDIKPWVRFGISPAGAAGAGLKSSDNLPPLSQFCKASDYQYNSLASDPIAWLRNQSIDYISPQLYWVTTHSTNPFGPMTEWWSIVADHFGRHHFASHSISLLNDNNTEANRNDIIEQIRLSRDKATGGIFGSILYSTKTYMGNAELQNMVRTQRFQHPATVPAMTWYNAKDLGKIEGLTLTGTTLSWTAKDNSRYVVYAVPSNVTNSAAASENGGLMADYIVGITYTNSATVPEGDYRYGVAALDRYGNEWEVAFLGDADGTYVPATDPAQYDDVVIKEGEDKVTEFGLYNMWVHTPDQSPLDLAIELHRDMVAFPGNDKVEEGVYLIERSEAASNASTSIICFDANTGERKKTIQLTYDGNFNNGIYPGNGLLLDDGGQMLTHCLSLANNNLSIAVVDPSTGKCSTVFNEKTELRVDHLDVYGTAKAGETWYVFAPSSTGVIRWTMNGLSVGKKETMTLEGVGNASRIHAISGDKFWLDGQGMHPSLYTFGTKTPIATLAGSSFVPNSTNTTAMVTFSLAGNSFMLYQYDYPGKDPGVRWSLVHGTDFAEGTDGAKQLWVFPTSGAGKSTMTSGDFGAPVSMLPGMPATTMAEEPSEETARLYAYSPGNGLVGYMLKQKITTGVENISADDNAENDIYYDLRGSRIQSGKLIPGVYIHKKGHTVEKVIIK